MNNNDYKNIIELLFFKYSDSTKNNLLKFLNNYSTLEINLKF